MTKHDKILRSKLGLLKLVEELGNVSRACELMGYSRDSYYRLKELYDKGGVLALQEKSRKKPNLKNRVDESVEASIIKLAFQQPFYGQSKASEELKKKGILVSPAGVRSVWQRYDLENFYKRLEALGTKMLQDGYHPNDWQIKALQQAKLQRNVNNPLDTYFPGHILLHSVEQVANHQTLGRLFQYVILDTYTRLAFVHLYSDNNSEVAVMSLENKVVPFFKNEGLIIHRIGTVKEDCFYGKTMHHRYRKFTKDCGINIVYLPKSSPQLKPMANFQRLVTDDFFSEAFRNKTYNSIAAIQADLDLWVSTYNQEKPIYERYNYGKTPMQTFKSILPFTKYLMHGKSKNFPNGLHNFMDLLKPLVIPAD